MFTIQIVNNNDSHPKIVFSTLADANAYGCWYAKTYNVSVEVHEVHASADDHVATLVKNMSKDFIKLLELDSFIRDGALTVAFAKFVMQLFVSFKQTREDDPVKEVPWKKLVDAITEEHGLVFGTMLTLYGEAALGQLQSFTTNYVNEIHAIVKAAGLMIPAPPAVPTGHRLLVSHQTGTGSTLIVFGESKNCDVVSLTKDGPSPQVPGQYHKATYVTKFVAADTTVPAVAGASTDPPPPTPTDAYEITVSGLCVPGMDDLTFRVDTEFKLIK